MVSDILFLAKADYSLTHQNLQKINLSNEISTIFDFYDAFATEKNIEFKQTSNGIIKVDSTMIRRAFNNLISNAIKYGEPNSIVEIQLI